MAQGTLAVGVITAAKKIRLTFDMPSGNRVEFDMTPQEAGQHIQSMITALEHITGKKAGKLILPPGWQS